MRDVERAMKVIVWFYTNSELIDEVIGEEGNGRDEDSSDDYCKFEDDFDCSHDKHEMTKPVRTLKLFLLKFHLFPLQI